MLKSIWKRIKGFFDKEKTYIVADKKRALLIGVLIILVILFIISCINIIRIWVQRERIKKIYEEMNAEYVNTQTVDAIDNETDALNVAEPEGAESTESTSFVAENDSEADEESTAWYNLAEVDLISLQEKNPDVVGWIYFEDGESISNPVLYSGDDKYLDKNYLGEEAEEGAIYIEKYNKPDLSDAHTIIYGHNMANGTMFGPLHKYKQDTEYIEDHQYFQIITENKIYRYKIFAYKDVNAATSGVFVIYRVANEDFTQFVKDKIMPQTYYMDDTDISEIKSVVTLSTCSYDSEVRFIVCGYLVEEHDLL